MNSLLRAASRQRAAGDKSASARAAARAGLASQREVSDRAGTAVIVSAGIIGLTVGFGAALLLLKIEGANYLNAAIALGALLLAAIAAWYAARFEEKAESLEEKLLAERSYEVFIDNAIEGFFRTTFDGKYLKVNRALAEIYGYESPEQLINEITDIGKGLYVDPRQRTAFQEFMKADSYVHEFVSEINRRDGRKIWIAENARTVYGDDGQILCYEGTVEDVTAKHQTEEALRLALNESQDAARAKAAFLAAISHELKTPLTAVIGFSDIMRQEMFGPLGDPHYSGYTVAIHSNGAKLLNMINDILDLTRVEGGLIDLDDDTVLIADVVSSACATALAQSEAPPSVTTHISPNLPFLQADQKRVRQILGHIISNAVKFTTKEGKVDITADLDLEGGIVVTVRDTGIGMAKDRIGHALEPFKQLDVRIARRFEGVGLGLPLANALTRLHGGELTFESAPGEGTTVKIAFPPERTIAAVNAICA